MDIPEIRLHVGAFLDIHSLARCARVSKSWNELLSPLIYSTASAVQYHAHWPSFEKHLCFVRDLEVALYLTWPQLCGILLECTLLRGLCLDPDVFDSGMDFYATLLSRNPMLVRVNMVALRPQVANPALLKTLVLNCPRVTELGLSMLFLDRQCLDSIFDLSRRLTKLELNRCWLKHRLTLPEDWPEFPILRELIVASSQVHVPWRDQIVLFQGMPKLESLSWTIVEHRQFVATDNTEEFVQALCSIFLNPQQCCWPRLDSIRLAIEPHGYTFSDDQIALLLRNCPNDLRRLTLANAKFDILSWRAFQRHVKSLQVLQLHAPSWMNGAILASCPNLLEFRGQ